MMKGNEPKLDFNPSNGFSLACSCLLLCSTGMLYGFPLWIQEMKTIFDFSQPMVSSMGSAIYAAQLLSIFLAPILDKLHISVSLLSSFLVLITGYFIIYYTVLVGVRSGVAMVSSGCCLGVSSGVIFAVITAHLMTQFHDQHSLFVGAMLTLSYGIGGALASFASVYWKLQVVMLGCIIICTVSALIAVPLLVYCSAEHPKQVQQTSDGTKIQVSEEGYGNAESEELEDKKWRGYGILRRYFSDARAYMIILILFCKVGIGSSFSSNLEAFMKSVTSEPPTTTTTTTTTTSTITSASLASSSLSTTSESSSTALSLVVPLFATGQVMGRLLVVVLSRTFSTLTLITMTSLCFAVVLFGTSSTYLVPHLSYPLLLAAVALFSVAYGAMWSCNTTVIFEGSVKERSEWLLLGAVSYPFGSIATVVLNFMVGVMYDNEANSHHQSCIGRDCFSTSYQILGALAILVAILSLILNRMNSSSSKRSEASKDPASTRLLDPAA